MTSHILCAVDLTHEEEALRLVAEAGRLAGLEEATISLVTVLPDYGSSWVGTFFKPDTLHDAARVAQESLHELASKAIPDFGAVQCIVEIGNAYEEVLDAAVKCGADLIVVGAHKPDLTDRIIGPNAARIARNAKISVLVVRLPGKS